MFLHRFKRLIFKNLLTRNKTHFKYFTNIPFEDIPTISPNLIKKTLQKHGIQYDEGYTCFISVCPMCHKKSKTLRSSSKIYINKNTGTFIGPACYHSGQWDQLLVYLDAKDKSKKKDIDLVFNTEEAKKVELFLKNVEEESYTLKTISKDIVESILENLKLPNISNTTLDHLGIRIDTKKSHLYFPLENVESKLVGYMVLKNTKNPTIEPVPLSTGILIGKSQRNKDSAILVPNISDFLVLLESKINQNVICLPNGLMNLPIEILPSLERFHKLVLWFGNDLKSWGVARVYAKKLGEKRCLFVHPTDKQPLPHLLESPKEISSIIAKSQPIWHKSITTFSSLRQDIFSDLQNIDKVQGIKWKRFPSLNKALKGHRKGELTVITGPTGSGKTTFISEYSLDLAMQGVNTLWGSFEIRNARLARTMLQQFSSIPLDEHLDQFDKWADEFEQLQIYFMTFHGQQSVKVVMEAVEHATYVHDIAHVIIDNVQFMMGITEDPKYMDRFYKQDVIIAAFRSFATRTNTHVTLVIHPRKERDELDLTTSSIFGSAKASQEADNVLIIQDKRLQSLRGKKYLQIAKNRYSGDLGVMPLEFDKTALSFAQKKKKQNEPKSSNVVE